MDKADLLMLFLWGTLGLIPAICIVYYIQQEIRRFLELRKLSEEERKEKKEKEKEQRFRRQAKLEEWINTLFGGAIFLAGILLIFSGIFVLLYQCYFWLQNGTWLEIPFWKTLILFDESVLNGLDISWKGIEKIIISILNQSSSLVLFALGFIVSLIGLMITGD